MSLDIPSRARPIIAFWGVETGSGARIKALACIFIDGRCDRPACTCAVRCAAVDGSGVVGVKVIILPKMKLKLSSPKARSLITKQNA